ncbi:MAG: 50S ribosomal protein L23 [Candidatus Caenarcaniphilales bacterium]|nr:50S ribosomal protein L23 [Candidatus Caenarcaniphilales bacterium]
MAVKERQAVKIIKRPIITEKSTSLSELSKFTFEVDALANKYQIKEALEELFPDIKVKKVNIGKIFGGSKRTRTGRTKPKDSKKAIVTIEGDHIKYFPEV